MHPPPPIRCVEFFCVRQIRFWGKVRGLERDYFLCQGTVDENGKTAPFDTETVTFKRCAAVVANILLLGLELIYALVCSTDCIVWTPLPAVDEAMAAKCAAFNGYFTGDLSKVYGAVPEGDAEDGVFSSRDPRAVCLIDVLNVCLIDVLNDL